MTARNAQLPAFGHADLTNCEREQIHLAASIQPHGLLLVVEEPSLRIVQASSNAEAVLGMGKTVVGRPLSDLGGALVAAIKPHLSDKLDTIPRAVRVVAGTPRTSFDCLLHRPAGGGLVIELERAGPAVDLSRHVEQATQRIVAQSALKPLCDETASIFKDLTGFDRVMVYRFDEHGHGEVFSERREDELEAFLGNRYPATDIPQIARQLYIRNRVRVLVDVDYQPVPLEPRFSPLTGADLDMSLCFLRSMSPIHIQYLKNMGVCSTLVVSILVGGKLWGLVACHHYRPRFVHFEMRAVCELLVEVLGTRIAAIDSFSRAQAELSVRRLEQRMIDSISRDGDWRGALFDNPQALLTPVRAQGAALLFEGQVFTVGDVPSTQHLRELGAWLDEQAGEPLVVTASLGIDEPRFDMLTPVASGVLAVPISNSGGEHLIWFRPEQVRTVTWGGDPMKPMVIGNTPAELSPRRSFAQWHQVVERTSEPWTPADRAAARLIRESLSDVVLQFRSVRVLIAKDQLDAVTRQVKGSDQPVILIDEAGTILLANDTFHALVGRQSAELRHADDLAQLFKRKREVRQRIGDMLDRKTPWRGEVTLTAGRQPRTMLMRGDPVYSAPGRILGFVLLLVDLTERKAVEVARRQFQDIVIERHRLSTMRLDTKADQVFQSLLALVADNAQLAVLEICDGDDPAEMPVLLDSVRASLLRAAEVLEQLIWHAERASNATDD